MLWWLHTEDAVEQCPPLAHRERYSLAAPSNLMCQRRIMPSEKEFSEVKYITVDSIHVLLLNDKITDIENRWVVTRSLGWVSLISERKPWGTLAVMGAVSLSAPRPVTMLLDYSCVRSFSEESGLRVYEIFFFFLMCGCDFVVK